MTVLKLLVARGHEVLTVVSDGERAGLGPSVGQHARRLGVPVRPSSDMRSADFASWLQRSGADLLLNAHSLVIASPEVVRAAACGSYNLHPGPLPHYAGLNVPSWAVLRRERRHGVTLHLMTSRVDAGPVAYRSEFDVHEGDNALTVFSACIRAGYRLVEQLLDVLERGEAVPQHAQDPSLRRWFPAGPPDEGALRWDRSAQDVVAFVRACDYGPFRSPWGHPRSVSARGPVDLLRASSTGISADRPPGTVGALTGSGALVAACDDWVRVEQIAVEGRRVDPGQVLVIGERLVAGFV